MNEVNLYGRSALHIASFNNNLDLVRLLVEDYGADVNSVMKVRTHYLTPLDAANQNASDEVADYLPSVGGKPIAQINKKVDEYLRHHQQQQQHQMETTSETDLDHFVGFDSSMEESEEYRQLRERYARTKRSAMKQTNNETKLPNLVKNGHETKYSNNVRALSNTSSVKSAATHSAHGGHVHNVREVDQQLASCGHHHLRQAIITNVYLTTSTPPPVALMSPGGTHRRTPAPIKKGGKKLRKTPGMTVANGIRPKENGRVVKSADKEEEEFEYDNKEEEEIHNVTSEGVKVIINAKDTFVSRHETREDKLELIEQLQNATGAEGTRVLVESMTRTRVESQDGSVEGREHETDSEEELEEHSKQEKYEEHEETTEKTTEEIEQEENENVKRRKRSIEEVEFSNERKIYEKEDKEDVNKVIEQGQELSMIDEDIEGETSKVTEADKTVPSAKTSRAQTIDEEGSEMEMQKDDEDNDEETREDETTTKSKIEENEEIKKSAEKDDSLIEGIKDSQSIYSDSDSNATTAKEDEDDGQTEDEMDKENTTSLKNVDVEDVHSVGEETSTVDRNEDQESILSKEMEDDVIVDADKQDVEKGQNETENAKQDEKIKPVDGEQESESENKENDNLQDEETNSIDDEQNSMEKSTDKDKESKNLEDQGILTKASMESKQESLEKLEESKMLERKLSSDDQNKSRKSSINEVDKDQKDEDIIKSEDDSLHKRKFSEDKHKSMEMEENVVNEDNELDAAQEKDESDSGNNKQPENEDKKDNYFDKLVDEAKEEAIDIINEQLIGDKVNDLSKDVDNNIENESQKEKEGNSTSDHETENGPEKLIKKRSAGSLQSEKQESLEEHSLGSKVLQKQVTININEEDVSRVLPRQNSAVMLSDAEEIRQEQTSSFTKILTSDENANDDVLVVDKLKTSIETLKIETNKDKVRPKEDKDGETDKEDFRDNATFLKDRSDEEDDEDGGHVRQQYAHKTTGHFSEGHTHVRKANKQYAHIRPKVDTFWGPGHGRDGTEGLNRHHSRSIHLGPLTAQEQYGQIDPAVIQQTVEKYVRK